MVISLEPFHQKENFGLFISNIGDGLGVRVWVVVIREGSPLAQAKVAVPQDTEVTPCSCLCWLPRVQLDWSAMWRRARARVGDMLL